MSPRLLPLLLLLLSGCVSSSSKPESPSAARFRLAAPTERATILHGITRTFDLTLDRDADFASAITLDVEVNPPNDGVTARITPSGLDATSSSAKLVVTVSEFARPGDYTLPVTAHADGSPTATVDVHLTVPPKD